MATFNGSQYVIRQLESILVQLSNNDEVIISDDNSTDNTCDLLMSLNDKRIIVIKNSSGKGPVSNFENVLKIAKGDFIFLSDQDDIWLPDKVSVMCAGLARNHLVLSNCEVVDKELTTIIPSFFDYRKSRPGFLRNIYKNSYIGCCMAFRREVLSYALPFPKSIHMHDWWIGLLVELNGNVEFIDQPLMKYIRHGNNASPTGELSTYTITTQVQNRVVMLWYLLKRRLK